MKKEELILFPYVRKMVDAESRGTKQETPHFGTVQNPIAKIKLVRFPPFEGARGESLINIELKNIIQNNNEKNSLRHPAHR